MPAIKPHSTPTSEGPWDGPAAETRLKVGQDADYYRKAYAWQDPEGDPTTKAAFRFLHHEVNESGEIGPANVTACRTGIAVLNGARGGTTIPKEDYRGVWEHLARHLEDAGLEPPELKQRAAPDEVERRSFPLEVRAEGDEQAPRLVRVLKK